MRHPMRCVTPFGLLQQPRRPHRRSAPAAQAEPSSTPAPAQVQREELRRPCRASDQNWRTPSCYTPIQKNNGCPWAVQEKMRCFKTVYESTRLLLAALCVCVCLTSAAADTAPNGRVLSSRRSTGFHVDRHAVRGVEFSQPCVYECPCRYWHANAPRVLVYVHHLPSLHVLLWRKVHLVRRVQSANSDHG